MVTKDSMVVILQHAVDDAEANTSRYVYTRERETMERELINFCLATPGNTSSIHIRDVHQFSIF